jgi:hypothetical protein
VTEPLVLEPGARVRVIYTNHRGETRPRWLLIHSLTMWHSTEWHEEPGWMVCAEDVNRPEAGRRWFSLAGMRAG